MVNKLFRKDDCISLNFRNFYAGVRQGVVLTGAGSLVVWGKGGTIVSAPHNAIQEYNQWGWVPHE